jgi:hypothetical protein
VSTEEKHNLWTFSRGQGRSEGNMANVKEMMNNCRILVEELYTMKSHKIPRGSMILKSNLEANCVSNKEI